MQGNRIAQSTAREPRQVASQELSQEHAESASSSSETSAGLVGEPPLQQQGNPMASITPAVDRMLKVSCVILIVVCMLLLPKWQELMYILNELR